MSKRKSAEAAPITIFPGDRTPSEFEIQALYEAALRRQREFYGAPSTTVEALMHELRTLGLGALAGSNCRRRLAELNREQLQDMIRRLMRLRPRYPAITDELPFQLGEQL
jgi:hypothetical protein